MNAMLKLGFTVWFVGIAIMIGGIIWDFSSLFGMLLQTAGIFIAIVGMQRQKKIDAQNPDAQQAVHS